MNTQPETLSFTFEGMGVPSKANGQRMIPKFRNGKRSNPMIIPSERFYQFRELALYALKRQFLRQVPTGRWKYWDQPVEIIGTFTWAKGVRSSDIDNVQKGLHDLLDGKELGIIKNDRQIVHVDYWKQEKAPASGFQIEIIPLKKQA